MLASSLYRNGVKLARYARWGQQIGVHRGMRASATALSIEVRRIKGSDVLNDFTPNYPLLEILVITFYSR